MRASQIWTSLSLAASTRLLSGDHCRKSMPSDSPWETYVTSLCPLKVSHIDRVPSSSEETSKYPLGDNAAEVDASPRNAEIRVPVTAFHNCTVPSRELSSSNWLSLDQSMRCHPPACPASVKTFCPVRGFQTCTTPSSPLLTMRLPSGDQAMCRIPLA